jgi:hypothetical protein
LGLFFYETPLPNFIKRKHPSKGKKKKQRGKDQSLGKQIAQKRQAIGRGGKEPIKIEPSAIHMKHINEREGR